MSPNLKTHQQALLRHIVAHAPVPAREVDGRTARPLRAGGLILEAGGELFPTAQGRAVVAGAPAGTSASPGAAALSPAQSELLWALQRQAGNRRADELDGRTLRGLVTRGLVTVRRGQVTLTPAGRARSPEDRRPGRRQARKVDPRAEMILRAVNRVESLAPLDSEVQVGPMIAHIDDLILGLRRYARRGRTPAQS